MMARYEQLNIKILILRSAYKRMRITIAYGVHLMLVTFRLRVFKDRHFDQNTFCEGKLKEQYTPFSIDN